MRKLLKVMAVLLPFISIGSLFVIFNLSNPVDIGPGGILVVFVLIYLFFASSFFVIMHLGVRLLSRLVASRKSIDHRHWTIEVRRAYYIASALAFTPVVLLAMQSVGQLQARDVLLVALLEILTIFYIVKRAA